MFNRKEIKEKAKQVFQSNYWPCVLVSFIITAIAGVCSFTYSMRSSSSQVSYLITLNEGPDVIHEAVGFSLPIIILTGLVSLVLVCLVILPIKQGCHRFFLINTEAKANVNEVGYAFRMKYGNIVLTSLLVDVYTFLWTLLFFIPGIIKSYSYMLVPYILAEDPNISPNEAITKSRQMMDGNKMDAFILDLSFIGWAILAVVTCGIVGIFFTDPYILQTKAEMYQAIKVARQTTQNTATAQ